MITSLEVGLQSSASAQVVLDGKFGTTGPLSGPSYSIPAEIGATRGNNLFHSFNQFNLATGESATFSGPANIQNILARVTGGTASSIDGTIRSEIAGANFFLINPSGIHFGPNASIDVSGSFAASTADYLKLADGARFAAALSADDSMLSTAPVVAFGFLGSAPAALQVESALNVREGKEMTIVGGDVLLEKGGLVAPGGQITAVSTRGAGEVALANPGVGPGGLIELRDGAKIDASGDAGGRVIIRGGRLVVDGSKIEANSNGSGAGKGIDIELAESVSLSNAGQINSLSPGGLGAGGNIRVTAPLIEMNGGGLTDDFFNPTTGISAATGDPLFGGGPARGGDISIHAGRLDMVNSAQISSASYGSGDAGRINIEADSIRLDAQFVTPTQITANTQQFDAGGKAGDITIRTGSFELLNGATVLAASFGSAPAGQIDLTAKSVSILSGGIVTAGTFGSGPGGNVQVTADTLRIDGRNPETGTDGLSGIQAVTTSSDSPAPGGTIHINSGAVDIVNSGSIFTSSFGLGQGGDIHVATKSLTLGNAGTIRAAGEATGAAGNISINAAGPVLLVNHGSINTSAPGSSGGNITLWSESGVRVDSAEISARAGLNGGNVSVASASLIYLRHGTITGQADTTGTGFGNGGNLTLEPSLLVLNDGSLISKSSFGNGGNISILSDFFFPSGSLIDASAPFGLPGTVQVTAPEVDLSGVLAILPGNLFDAGTLLRPDCGIRLGGNVSSFIVSGRGGLPLVPGGWVPSAAPGEQDDRK